MLNEHLQSDLWAIVPRKPAQNVAQNCTLILHGCGEFKSATYFHKIIGKHVWLPAPKVEDNAFCGQWRAAFFASFPIFMAAIRKIPMIRYSSIWNKLPENVGINSSASANFENEVREAITVQNL